MKIAIIQDFLRSGGTERQTILLANAFAASGHLPTLLTFRPGGALNDTVSTTVRRRSLQPFDVGFDWFAPGLIRETRAVAPDIVLCMGRMANCYSQKLQEKLPTIPVIATMRTGKSLPGAFRRSLVAVRHIVANSHDARDTLVRDHAIPAHKISVIHNSLVFPPVSSDGGAVAPDVRGPGETRSFRKTLRALHGATPATRVLLSVAMFRPEKNQRELIEIVADLPRELDWQLWLMGDGPTRPACEQLAAAKKLTDRVRFPGFHRDPSPFYLAADLAVHASRSEALSNFLIEAQAHGLPAVAYDAQGIRECFIPGQTGWPITAGDRSAFRSALLHLFNQPAATRTAIATAARAYARETFDPQHQVAAYLDLFARLK